MKRFFFLVPFLFLFGNVDAQLFKVFGHDVGFIYVGPKVGMTYSTISNFSDLTGSDTKSKFGYQFGAVGEFGFTSKFSIQTELLFYSRGVRYEDIDGGVRMNYIGIPLLAKYSFKVLGLTKFYAMGGTFADIRTKGEWYDGNGQTSDLGSGFKKYDWGFSFGAGAEYPMKKGIWALDIRYNLGITDLHDDAGDDTKTRSRSFGFALTYKFDVIDIFRGLKKKEAKKESTESTEGKSKAKGLKVEG
ncbi:MAG: porin family protein [Bacteroidales bacterium]